MVQSCAFTGGNINCFPKVVDALTKAVKIDVANSNGVNYLETVTKAYTFVRKSKTSGCGEATVTNYRNGDLLEPHKISWYVGSGRTCSVVDSDRNQKCKLSMERKSF